jgi:predicted RNA-binding protein YlqC (UPF0109 family)
MQAILEFILKSIVTTPDDVKITVQDEEGTTHFIISLNAADVGRVIGKEGKVIKAIRTIMRVIAIQQGIHIRISVDSQDAPQVEQPEQEAEVAPREATAPADDGSITVEV